MNDVSRTAKWLYGSAIALLIAFMYIPMITVALASFSKSRYFKFPIPDWSASWYSKVYESLSIRELFSTSMVIAIIVGIVSTTIAFFGALAFARYDWGGRRIFQKLILLPILFPQAVLGLALLLWFTAIGITPSWQATVFAHLVWIAPIATLVIAIQVYSFDPVVEEAAFDLGATRWQVMKEVTLPLLAPGIFSGFTFSFLLSWANFPLSLFSSGADSTIPEWISAKIQSGYTPQVPAVGSLTMGAAAAVMILGYGLMMLMAWRKPKLASA